MMDSHGGDQRVRLAVVAGHPVQYVAPWLERLAQESRLDLNVFYLWDLGVSEARDPGFLQPLQWDIPLLEGYRHVFIPNRSKNPGNHHFLGYINPSLNRSLSAWKPDMVLLMNYAFLSYLLLMIDPRFWGIPFFFRGDSHDLARSHGVRSWLGRTLRRLIFRRFAAFLVVGQANRTYYRLCGVPASRLIDAPHAVDNDRFLAAADGARRDALQMRERLGIPPDHVVVLFVGKFVDVKRPFDILEAFDQLPDDLRDGAALVFVGDGPHGASLILRARDRGLTNVHVLPFQNQQAMPAIYALGNVLVLASQSETWGLVVNEAMNLECPAIVTDQVGCRGDLVVEGRTGWIYPTGDIAALNRCMHEALEDPDRLRAMGREARRHVAGFNFYGITAGLLDAIDRSSSGGGTLRRQPPKIATHEPG
jgi:glycosyltransferase involved in cell wall biosynthesis